ncbi:hypothetical protein HMPREF0063_10560 [Aeromicrobium marinum DSM 15272]|uniref:Tat pathway signal sequence domain protein n=1 Tax=Aeromicrobium marinum DSM 15272 TaxID=585531 RepID=E2S9C0_9ACTN|nr:hypothetical protein [Aeromicrobium marinum]EFQ83844.1 hypothetical protein HMPREF0063_10560 [Aeromicrobium marinum DSM 15272]
MSTFTSRKKVFAGIAVAAIASLPLAACSSSDDGDDATVSNSSEVVAEITALTGEDTAVLLDAGFAGALESLGLTPGTVGDGELVDGSLVFPITGGNVTYFTPGTASPYVIGQVQHEGSGFSLSAGDITVEITNLNVDPGVSRVYGDVSVNGELVASSAYIFTLNGSTLNPLDVQGDTAVLQGTEVYVSPVAAGLLNSTFGTDAVTEDLLVGIATITVNTTSGDDGN